MLSTVGPALVSVCYIMLAQPFSLLSWNVRGLNCPDRRATVHETIASTSCHLVCLQETKLDDVDQFVAAFLGGHRLRSFAQRPAVGTRGGILMLWDENVVGISNIVASEFCLSADVQILANDTTFKITSVYGPTSSSRKDDFFAELLALRPPLGIKWLTLGDFNQIYRARDKNKRNVNMSRISRFRAALNSCELREIHLQNRRFTWSNERQNPTLCKLDSFFCNDEWDVCFGNHVLHALSSSLSDHCPLLLAEECGPRRPRTFKFENFWTSIPGFQEVVKEAWQQDTRHTDPYQILFQKLKTTGTRLKAWSRSLFSKAKIQLHAALMVILRLDVAQESRTLAPDELELRSRLKRRVISLSVIERSRKKQCSRITSLKDGDANTKFFHLRVNARRRKNHILRLKHNNGWVTGHEDKEEIITEHFSNTLGRTGRRKHDLNWQNLNFPDLELHELGAPFSEAEVRAAIFQMPSDKAPGPDGFTGAFFKSCWEIINLDVMKVIHCFGSLQNANLQWLNSANVVLLPKKDGAESIADYRPISLIHAIAKIIAKMLALRLTPHMDKLVSNSQSAFIKKRSIHDNFMYVRNLARRLNRSKTPSLLFKLDIRKAFDSVRWDYILDLLQRRGFPNIFREWITALLRTSSSRVLLNGIAGPPIRHGKGFRQGDPLSPLLFVIAIDPLQQILDLATTHGLLHKIRGRGSSFRTSLYADDAAIFVKPVQEDVSNLATILQCFGEVTGLCTNFQKSSVVPIRCRNLDLEAILQGLPAARASFPMKYLGLPLSVWQLKRVDFQYLEDKVAAKLVPWEGRYIAAPGRGVLVMSVLTSLVVYTATALIIPPGTLLNITRVERAFLWSGSSKTTGAKCKVSWDKVCRPKDLGGLGVLNLEKFSQALRLRWLWFEWTEPSRLWVGLGNPCNDADKVFFYASTSITIGNGARAPFWESPWLNGRKPKDIAPLIFDVSKRKNWKVREALREGAWIGKIDMTTTFTADHVRQFFTLWIALREVHLSEDVEDSILWKHTISGDYSASSAYNAQFLTITRSAMYKVVWKAWAPPKVKFLAWLAIQDRVWTAVRLAKRGWPNCGPCPLCKREPETVEHLFFQCRYTLRVWAFVKDWLQLVEVDTSVWATATSIEDWWIDMASTQSIHKRAMPSIIMLVSKAIWDERNARVFRNHSAPSFILLQAIKIEARLWAIAGAKFLGQMMPGE